MNINVDELLQLPDVGERPENEERAAEEDEVRHELARAKAQQRSNSVVLRSDPVPAPAATRILPAPAASRAVFRSPVYQRNPDALPVARLSGDKATLIAGYQDVSICNTLANNAIGRAKVAASMLDEKHREIILSELRSAEMKNKNAAHKGIRSVPLKRAVAIALKAEQWVYQAQAAAAKHANKEAQACRRKLSGRHKMTKEEKDERYLKRFGVPRGTKGERTAAIKERARQKRAAVAAAKRSM